VRHNESETKRKEKDITRRLEFLPAAAINGIDAGRVCQSKCFFEAMRVNFGSAFTGAGAGAVDAVVVDAAVLVGGLAAFSGQGLFCFWLLWGCQPVRVDFCAALGFALADPGVVSAVVDTILMLLSPTLLSPSSHPPGKEPSSMAKLSAVVVGYLLVASK
jgi:hypothetical protein